MFTHACVAIIEMIIFLLLKIEINFVKIRIFAKLKI